jgi:hypothetical protein
VTELRKHWEMWLTDDECRYLAMHARYRSGHEKDPRYQHQDPVERERLRLRWWEITEEFWPTDTGGGNG